MNYVKNEHIIFLKYGTNEKYMIIFITGLYLIRINIEQHENITICRYAKEQHITIKEYVEDNREKNVFKNKQWFAGNHTHIIQVYVCDKNIQETL